MKHRPAIFVEWKDAPPIYPIPGAPDYFVSASGKVFSYFGFKKPLRVRRAYTSANGYACLRLTHADGKIRTRFVHHVVAETWLGQMPPGCECIRHLDGNRNNNSSRNLAYGTHSQNNKDKELHGTGISGERNPCAVLSRTLVSAIRSKLADGHSQAKIARLFSVSPMTISRIANNQSWRNK
jgi:hypothetical protein